MCLIMLLIYNVTHGSTLGIFSDEPQMHIAVHDFVAVRVKRTGKKASDQMFVAKVGVHVHVHVCFVTFFILNVLINETIMHENVFQ